MLTDLLIGQWLVSLGREGEAGTSWGSVLASLSYRDLNSGPGIKEGEPEGVWSQLLEPLLWKPVALEPGKSL